jgi:lysophospholipase L1-like esterase
MRKKAMKKLIFALTALILAVAAIACVMPVGAAAASKETDYNGKIISILGDSISTFEGYVPKSDRFNLLHSAHYPRSNLFEDVKHTWWMQLIDRLDAKLGINDSWSGTTVDGKDEKDKTAISSLQRIENLGAKGRPDVIVLFGGTNDYGLLNIVDKFDSTKMPTEVDLTTVQWGKLSQAYAHTILRIKHFFPTTQIVAVLPARTSSYYSVTELRDGNELLAAVCDHYGVPYVNLFAGPLTLAHLPDGIHPAEEGMDIITDEVLKVMLEKCTVTAGESETFTLTHKLKNTQANLKYYSAVRRGEKFTEKLTSSQEYIDVKITMGGVDITSSCYKDGTVLIENVTGDITITATGMKLSDTTVPETTVPEPETTVPETTVPETTAPETTAAQEGGCGSAVVLALIPALAVCALTVKRKK